MRDYEIVRRPRTRVLIFIAAVAVGVLLVFAASAATAAPRRIALARHWTVSKIEQGVGKKLIGQDAPQAGGAPSPGGVFDLGPAAFNFGLVSTPGRAAASVFSPGPGVTAQARVLDPFTPQSVKGGVAHVDEYRTYEKDVRPGDASLQTTIRLINLLAADANGTPASSECSDLSVFVCHPIQAVVRYHARAYAISPALCPSGPRPTTAFFNVGGAVYTEGYQHHWFVGAATLPDSRSPFWANVQFDSDGDVKGDHSGSLFQLLAPRINLNVPLGSVCLGQRFTVHVSLDAETIDDRGGESGAEAVIADPVHAGPGLIARGLTARGARKVRSRRYSRARRRAARRDRARMPVRCS